MSSLRIIQPDDDLEAETRALSIDGVGGTPGRALPSGPGASLPGASPSTTGGSITLFQNVRIFDGKSAALSAPSNVLVKGNTIERISSARSPSTRMITSASLRQRGGC